MQKETKKKLGFSFTIQMMPNTVPVLDLLQGAEAGFPASPDPVRNEVSVGL